jgi:hypothetical protein
VYPGVDVARFGIFAEHKTLFNNENGMLLLKVI